MNKNILKTTVSVSMVLLMVIGVSPFIVNNNKQDVSPNNAAMVNSASVVETGEIKAFETGDYHSGVVINDGTYDHLYTWGANNSGQLGLGTIDPEGDPNVDNYTPQEVTFDIGDEIIIEQLYMNSELSAAVVNDGIKDHLYIWGMNTPTPNEFITNADVVEIIDMAVGGSNYAAITEDSKGDNHLYMWGLNNSNGQQGIDTGTHNLTPTELILTVDGAQATVIKDVEMSQNYAAAIIENKDGGDELYTWGTNQNGGLGLGTPVGQIEFPTIVDLNSFSDNGSSVPDPSNGTSGGEITSLDLGLSHTAIIMDNELYIWGINDDYELGLGVTGDKALPQRIIIDSNSDAEIEINDVSAGKNNTLVLTTQDDEAHLYITGYGGNGNIGNGSYETVNKFVEITSFIPNFDESNDKIYSIQVGLNHVGIVVNSGEYNTLYEWGMNDDGQLGIGTNEQTNQITEVLSVELIEESNLLWLWITLGVIGIIVIILIALALSRKSWAKLLKKDNSKKTIA